MFYISSASGEHSKMHFTFITINYANKMEWQWEERSGKQCFCPIVCCKTHFLYYHYCKRQQKEEERKNDRRAGERERWENEEKNCSQYHNHHSLELMWNSVNVEQQRAIISYTHAFASNITFKMLTSTLYLISKRESCKYFRKIRFHQGRKTVQLARIYFRANEPTREKKRTHEEITFMRVQFLCIALTCTLYMKWCTHSVGKIEWDKNKKHICTWFLSGYTYAAFVFVHVRRVICLNTHKHTLHSLPKHTQQFDELIKFSLFVLFATQCC